MADWIWPMPRLGGRDPVISDGYGSPRDGGARRHAGVDVMYKRPRQVTKAQARADHGSTWFDCPIGVPVIAARAGKVWFAGRTERGFAVTLDHGNVPHLGPATTFYQHLDTLALKPTSKVGRNAIAVEQGQILGTVGYSPIDSEQIRHLHFELRLPTSGTPDIEARMANWPVVLRPRSLGAIALTPEGVTLLALLVAFFGRT